MKDEFRTDGDPLRGVFGARHKTSYDSYASLLHPKCFLANKGFLLTCIPQVREEEQVISLQFLGSQQDVSDSSMTATVVMTRAA